MTRPPGPIRRIALPAVLLACAGAGAVWTAGRAADWVEDSAIRDVDAALAAADVDWADVTADGLLVALDGEAPDEASRFKALSAVAGAVDATRIVDRLSVASAGSDEVPPPPYAIEILRAGDSVTLFGLIPAAMDLDTLLDRAAGIAGQGVRADLLDTADGPVPDGWEANVAHAFEMLEDFQQARLSLTPHTLLLTATVPDEATLAEVEEEIRETLPGGLDLTLSLSAPRPVISPFAFRATKGEGGTRVPVCAASRDEGRDVIVAAADRAGAGGFDCPLGLGAPSPDWAAAVAAGLDALATLPAGRLTLTDTSVQLTGDPPTTEAALDGAEQTLSAALPDAFVLSTTLARPQPDADEADPDAPPRFSAALTDEGARLRGRLGDPLTRAAVESFGRARFGAEAVEAAITDGGTVPDGWAVRVLAGLEALSVLNTGDLLVLEDQVTLSGRSGNADAPAAVAAILSNQLGPEADFAVDIEYVEELDPAAGLPTPEECLRRLDLVLESSPKITFAPGSTEIEATATVTIDALADVLRDCQTVAIEIGGHTDSQGRETMNLNLSQARADAVLTAIMARRVLTSNLTAKGYGETEPIADNGTEAGREENRRIEFVLTDGETQVAAADTDTDTGAEGETATDAGDAAASDGADADDAESNGADTALADDATPAETDANADDEDDEAAGDGPPDADAGSDDAPDPDAPNTDGGAKRVRAPGADRPLAQVPVAEIAAQTPDADTVTPRPRPEQDE